MEIERCCASSSQWSYKLLLAKVLTQQKATLVALNEEKNLKRLLDHLNCAFTASESWYIQDKALPKFNKVVWNIFKNALRKFYSCQVQNIIAHHSTTTTKQFYGSQKPVWFCCYTQNLPLNQKIFYAHLKNKHNKIQIRLFVNKR